MAVAMLGVAIGLSSPEVGEQVLSAIARRSSGSAGNVAVKSKEQARLLRALAHQLSLGPLPRLIEARLALIAVAALIEPDDRIREGLLRLIPHALSERERDSLEPWYRLNDLYDRIGIDPMNAEKVAPLRKGWRTASAEWRRWAQYLARLSENKHALSPGDMRLLNAARAWLKSPQKRLKMHSTFIWVVIHLGQDDPELVEGLVQTVKFILQDRSEKSHAAADWLLRNCEHRLPPPAIRPYLFELEDFLREGPKDR